MYFHKNIFDQQVILRTHGTLEIWFVPEYAYLLNFIEGDYFTLGYNSYMDTLLVKIKNPNERKSFFSEISVDLAKLVNYDAWNQLLVSYNLQTRTVEVLFNGFRFKDGVSEQLFLFNHLTQQVETRKESIAGIKRNGEWLNYSEWVQLGIPSELDMIKRS